MRRLNGFAAIALAVAFLAGCGGPRTRPAGPDGGGAAGTGPDFPAGAAFYQDVSNAPLAANSADVVDWVQSHGGWGTGQLRIDFSMQVLAAGADTPLRSFSPTSDFYTPDCDLEKVPVPPGGALEGETGYACDHGGDCHLIVVDGATNQLFEMWRADIRGSDFSGGCLAVWDLSRVYGPAGRGYGCTSADAAGLPIAPLLIRPDEVAAGSIDHAVRFILPNDRIESGFYVAPATHSTSAAGGGALAPPFGARFRLRADFPVSSLPSRGARVVARAMQRYGIILADGGQIALTAESDRFTAAKWNGLLGSDDLSAIQFSDLELVDSGKQRAYDGNCVRVK